MLYLFNVTVFCLILLAATLFFSRPLRISSLLSDPLNLGPELNRVVFELSCYFPKKNDWSAGGAFVPEDLSFKHDLQLG